MAPVLPIATLLLAAGASRRLGQPKQLLSFRSSTLLRHAAQTALSAELGPVFVVLGCREAECRETLASLPVEFVSHPGWEQGLGSSIAAGMRRIDEAAFRAVLLLLCDQPLVTAADLQALAREMPGHEVVASAFGLALGPPALFAAALFPKLRTLHGPPGAKSVIEHCATLATHPCPHAATDIDTADDVAALK